MNWQKLKKCWKKNENLSLECLYCSIYFGKRCYRKKVLSGRKKLPPLLVRLKALKPPINLITPNKRAPSIFINKNTLFTDPYINIYSDFLWKCKNVSLLASFLPFGRRVVGGSFPFSHAAIFRQKMATVSQFYYEIAVPSKVRVKWNFSGFESQRR